MMGGMRRIRMHGWTTAVGFTFSLLLQTGCLFTVTWLPDGKRLAYIQAESIWLIDLEGNKRKIYDAPGLDIGYLVAAPTRNRLALLGEGSDSSPLTILNDTGEVLWSGTLPGRAYTLLPSYWSPNSETVFAFGERHGGGKLALVNLRTHALRLIETGGHVARFSKDGEILTFNLREAGESSLEILGPRGNPKTSLPWTIPAEITEPEAQLLSADGRRLWITDEAPKPGKIYLIDRKGKVLYVSEGEFNGLGPDDWSMVTRNGGFHLVNARKHTSVNLNQFYNHLVHDELTSHQADPSRANTKFKPNDVVFFPVFSPNGESFALHSAHGLYLANLQTRELRTLATW